MDGRHTIVTDIDFNYNDRPNIKDAKVDVCFTDEDDNMIWFNIPVGNKREDDYALVPFRIDDFIEALGKAIQRKK